MEASSSTLVFRPNKSFSHGSSGKQDYLSRNRCYFRPRKNEGFLDNSHLQYYYNGVSIIMCDGKKKDVAKTKKKKLKLLKGLSSSNLSLFQEMDGSVHGRNRKMSSELSEILMAQQLQQLKSEKKEMKKKRKQKKTKLKAFKMKSMKKDTSDSSSSSSDSSESECEQAVEMNRLRSSALAQDTTFAEPSLLGNTSASICWDASYATPTPSSVGEKQSAVVVESFAERIEVCMGSKCKKLGAEALFKELERKIGAEGAVVGCKCMGKCKSAPNVRVSNTSKKDLVLDNSVRAPTITNRTVYTLE